MIKHEKKEANNHRKLALYMQICVANPSMMNQKQKLQAQSANIHKLSFKNVSKPQHNK